MSSDQNVKKRRIESHETPKAVSAISAIAARRRGNASTAVAPTNTAEEDRPAASNVNFFSPLQKRDSQNGSPKPAQKRASRLQRPLRGVESPTTASGGLSTSSGREESSTASSSIAPQSTQYSSFRLTKSNHRTKAGGVVELRLGEGERFLVLGSYGIRVLHGELTIAGASLRPSEAIHWVHAPHCHGVPVLRTLANIHIELHPDPSAWGLRQLAKLSPLFRRIWNEPSESTPLKKGSKGASFQILCTSDDAPKKCIIQSLVSPAEWNKKLAGLVSAARKKPALKALICGPKSAGKSTFSKLVANRLLTDQSLSGALSGLMVLDLDPGQPEFAPAGTLSLVHITQPNFGTPFTHPGVQEAPYRVVRCHALASVTPASNPDLYFQCAANLFDVYRTTWSTLPLIINTPGWILGTGLDLLEEVIKAITPDEVVYMSEDGPNETVEALQSATVGTFTELPSQQSEFTSRTAAHLRAMQIMSYFHSKCELAKASNAKDAASTLRWNAVPLLAKSPLLVRYSSPKPGILGILSYDYQSPPDLLAETVNGMILAVVEIEDSKAFRGLAGGGPPTASQQNTMQLDSSEERDTLPTVVETPEGLPFIPNQNDFTLDPQYSHTIGLVLIRGIDTKNQSIQLLTPITTEQIRQVRLRGHHIVLVHGKFDAPNWAYTENLYERAGNDESSCKALEVADEDTSEDDSHAEPEEPEEVEKMRDIGGIPWVEVLKGNEKRPVGSRVWRVRRDLGRNAGD